MGIKVQTESGRVEGVTADGVHVFRGVPFAATTAADLRLRAPRPAGVWTGERAAVDYGDWAPQNPPVGLFSASLPGPQSEDCLNLNIWTPGLDGARRPVLLWIHGGGFIFGSGASPLYDGTRMASRGDVVLVTINYRLGILGFLAHPDLADDEAGGTFGNWGLLDQVAALRWVRQNIAAFGGEPDNVTIFGESAGGMSVADLLTAPSARGLFHKAIVQSGPPLAVAPERAERTAAAVLGELGLSRVEEIRRAPVADILAAQDRLVSRLRASGLPLIPVGDGHSLPRDPRTAIGAGAAAGIPLLIGTNRDEAKAMMAANPNAQNPDDAALRSYLAAAFKANRVELDVDEVIAGYREARGARGDSTSPRELWSAIETDRIFRVGSTRTAEAQSRHERRTFSYLFAWESPAWGGALGACHALEIPFVFGNLDAPRIDSWAGGGADAQALSDTMQDAWIAFARSGDPSTPRLGVWPAYESDRRQTLIFDREVRVEAAPNEAERRLWEAGVAAPRP